VIKILSFVLVWYKIDYPRRDLGFLPSLFALRQKVWRCLCLLLLYVNKSGGLVAGLSWKIWMVIWW
jgi:hypothetical protein